MNAKRWIAIFLAVVLTLSLIVGVLPTVFAAEAYTIGLWDSSKKNKITAEPGSTVEAYLYLAGNPGILSAGVLVKCPDGVEIIKVQSALSGHNFKPTWQYSKNYSVNPYLVWMLAPTGTSNNGLVTYNGNWCKLTFRLDAELAPGDHTIRLSAPKDKNLTAQTSGGVIKPNTNTYVSGVSVSNLTISVGEAVCDHNWSQWSTITPATCDKAGKQVRECSLCHTEQEKTIDATGHKMGSWISVETPTCTKAGKEKRVCQNENCQKIEWKTLEKLSHKYSQLKVLKEATCTKDGEKAGKCLLCGKDAKQTIPATGHDFGPMKIVRQPTAQKPGLKQSKCSRCGEVKKEEIPVIPEETTAETTEATTEVTTQATTEATTAETTVPEVTAGTETLPTNSVPIETQPGSDAPEETTLKNVIILAGALLLGTLLLIVLVAIWPKKK